MKAIILSRHDWRENDQIISLYSSERGKVEALARGVKKTLSKNSAALEPFCFVEAEIIPGREIARLGSVMPINIFKNIRADLSASLAAGYAMALVDKIVQAGEADARMFEMIRSWLEWIDANAVIPAQAGICPAKSQIPVFPKGVPLGHRMTITAFVAKFLTLLGFDPSFLGDNFQVLSHGSWQAIDALKFEFRELERVQKRLYHFALQHLERKIGDWGKLAEISEI